MTATELPRWDVTDLFPSIGSREYASAREQLGAELARLTALYDQHDVRGGDDKTIDDDTLAAFDEVGRDQRRDGAGSPAGRVLVVLRVDRLARCERIG
jgi:hypothetical protein